MRHFEHLSIEILEDIRLYIEANNSSVEAVSQSNPCREAPVLASPKKAPSKRGFGFKAKRVCESTFIDIPEKEPSFCERLFEIIDKKELRDSEVYKKADIDRRLFSKIRSDSDYHPSKSTAIRLCLALELNITQTEILLESAGYCLSLSDTADLVIRYCIEHKIFDIISVNEAIDYFSAKLI